MKAARNTVLSLLAVAALTAAILACTSFSPDDKKVLFPTFDPSGTVAIAVYDRETGRSELVYVPAVVKVADTNRSELTPLRAQWLPDGKNILVVSTEEGRDETLAVTMIPTVTPGTTRTYHIEGVHEPGLALMMPPCLSGHSFLFLAGEQSLAKLDLNTGDLKSVRLPEPSDKTYLYSAPDARGAFYFHERDKGAVVFGRVDPDRLTLTPLMTITNRLMEGSFFAYDASGSRVAFVEEREGECHCVLMENGRVRFSRKLGPSDKKLSFANGILSPKADRVWASFMRETETGRAARGLMEIPLSDAPLKEKILIQDMATNGDDLLYFPVGISHDGKAAALASTYLACNTEKFRSEDCAFFLIEMQEPAWKLTKVPIALPANRAHSQ